MPHDITEESLADFMQKCGLVEKDLETGKFKIKLYRDANGEVKGDALCTYIKVFFFCLKIIAKFVLALLLSKAVRRYSEDFLCKVCDSTCVLVRDPYTRNAIL